MSTMSNKLATDGQMNQVASIVGAAAKDVLKELGIDREGAQKLLTNGGALKDRLREPLMAAMREFGTSNQHASEEVRSTWTYPGEYTGAKPISKQVDIFAGAFGLSLGGTMEYIDKALPGLTLSEGAEGQFAIPSPEAIAKRHFPNITNPAERHARATEMMVEKLGGTRALQNYRAGQLGTQYLRQHVRTTQFFDRVAKVQTGDVWIVDAQFGLRHRGRSVRRAREVFTSTEFGLDAFSVVAMTLSHPERFVRWEQLHADCPGDEYDFEAQGEWARSPILYWGGGELGFYARWFRGPDGGYGSVSAFLPE